MQHKASHGGWGAAVSTDPEVPAGLRASVEGFIQRVPFDAPDLAGLSLDALLTNVGLYQQWADLEAELEILRHGAELRSFLTDAAHTRLSGAELMLARRAARVRRLISWVRTRYMDEFHRHSRGVPEWQRISERKEREAVSLMQALSLPRPLSALAGGIRNEGETVVSWRSRFLARVVSRRGPPDCEDDHNRRPLAPQRVHGGLLSGSTQRPLEKVPPSDRDRYERFIRARRRQRRRELDA